MATRFTLALALVRKPAEQAGHEDANHHNDGPDQLCGQVFIHGRHPSTEGSPA